MHCQPGIWWYFLIRSALWSAGLWLWLWLWRLWQFLQAVPAGLCAPVFRSRSLLPAPRSPLHPVRWLGAMVHGAMCYGHCGLRALPALAGVGCGWAVVCGMA
jgi:hypothetical protein